MDRISQSFHLETFGGGRVKGLSWLKDDCYTGVLSSNQSEHIYCVADAVAPVYLGSSRSGVQSETPDSSSYPACVQTFAADFKEH